MNHDHLELALFSNSVLDAFIQFFFYCMLIFVYFCTFFHNKINKFMHKLDGLQFVVLLDAWGLFKHYHLITL